MIISLKNNCLRIPPLLIFFAVIACDSNGRTEVHDTGHVTAIQLGSRPFYLIDGLDPGELKNRLQSCRDGPFRRTDFVIGHRGAPMQFPEHTEESYRAGALQGAGVLECDATFTNDGVLVCRHSECDLHTTTNILATELAKHCTTPFTPFDENKVDPKTGQPYPAQAECCTSDLSLDQFKMLTGKMDGSLATAKTVEEFMAGTPDWRTDLYTGRGTLLSHKESIRLIQGLGLKFAPELKEGNPDRLRQVFGGANAREAQQRYAQALIDDYKNADVQPVNVWPQSFNQFDLIYWVKNEPEFAKKAAYLDNRDDVIDPGDPSTFSPSMQQIFDSGIKTIASPIWMLLTVTDDGEIMSSAYATEAKKAGLDIIAWTFERSDLRFGSRTGVDSNGHPAATFYYQFDDDANHYVIEKDSDLYEALDVLAREVGVISVFSDWPATVTYYANCMDL